VNAQEAEFKILRSVYVRYSAAAVAATLLACASFAATASFALIVLFRIQHENGQIASSTILAIKGAFFLVVSAALCAFLYRLTRYSNQITVQPISERTTTRIEWFALLGTLLLISMEIFPNLDKYPWIAPDESHHLTVARNLAFYGVYGSGDPSVGFRLFDPYDSVGAPALVPVAVALKIVGPEASPSRRIFAARFVMAVFYLLLCATLFALFRPIFGAPQSLVGLLVMMASFGSSYLGRTLYGEAPALMFFCLGLIFWRKGFDASRFTFWPLLAGFFFGMAVLVKSILVLTFFPFLGALACEVASRQKIRIAHFIAPGFCALLVIAGWWVCQTMFQHNVSGEAEGTLSMYRHNLMFGWRSAGKAIGWIMNEPLAAIGLVCGALIAIPKILGERRDPPLIVLAMTAVFFLFWWIFFTPGQIPRYAWFTYAIAAMFAGTTAANGIIRALPFDKKKESSRKFARIAKGAAGLAVAALVIAPASERLSREYTEICAIDEMRDDRDLAACVKASPPDVRLSTIYWPVARTLNFLTDRHIENVDAIPADIRDGDSFIADLLARPNLLDSLKPSARCGRYAIFTHSVFDQEAKRGANAIQSEVSIKTP
jgi:4-amino-4-deoxy-L-arabinose transferase-like glycosyltransferase